MLRSVAVILLLLVFLLPVAPVFASPGDTVTSIPTPRCCPQGLTFDGTHLWNADRRTDMIYRIDPATGSVVDSIPTPGYAPLGLTWDGQRLWIIDADEELIYAVDPQTRIVEKTIYCPVSSPGGLAWDGEFLWISDDGGNTIDKISPEDGTTIISLPAPSSHPGGLTWDGEYLWVADRVQDMIYMITPDRGDVIISFASPGPHAWGLAWDGKNIWSADYQTDRIYKLVVDDGTLFSRMNEKTERVDFIHQVRNFGPDTMTVLDVYLAVPENLNSQEILGEIKYDPQPKEFLTDKWGQKVAHYEFTNLGATEFRTVTMTTDVRLYQNRYYIYPDKVGSLAEIPKEIREKYLVNDTKFDMENPIIRKAVQAAVGDETNPFWIARRIFNYIIEHMEYERVGGWNVAPTVLARGNGSCSEYTFVYIAMCRAAGLPARYAGSVVIRGDDASWDNVYHRWVEVYLPNFGWIPVDPSGGDSEWPGQQANSFGYLNNRFLITTIGGGGSEYLGWSYNSNEEWKSKGRCKIVVENFGEWSPLNMETE